MKKTKINIVSGFLGSGKTSFIKKLIKESDDFSKTVIIENEFGEVSIDGTILEREGLSVREINAGCICCSVADDFASSIKDIKKVFNPDKILIEPSGVGKLSDIKAICLKYPDLFEINRSITIVDASKYFMYKVNFGDFYLDQIKNSDTIVFSRYSQAKDSGIDMVEIIADIKKENNQAQVIDSEWDAFRAIDLLESKIQESKAGKLKIAQDRLGLFNSHGHHHPTNSIDKDGDQCSCHDNHKHSGDDFSSLTLGIEKTFSREDIQSILEDFDRGLYGNIVRAKGSLPGHESDLEFDYVPLEITIRDLDGANDHHVVIIGKDLNSEALSKVF
mgnify:FL=1